MENDFGWYYPPGVTGREKEITCESECPECGLFLTYDDGWYCEHCGWNEKGAS
jgi:ribosomal protein S27AE